MSELTAKIMLLLLGAFFGGAVTVIARVLWEKRSAGRLRKQFLIELDDVNIIVSAAIKGKSWQNREAKMQAERMLNLYGSGDALEMTHESHVKKELLEYFRSLGIFVEWFKLGGPYKPGDISLELPPDGSVHVEDIVPRSATDSFQFAQAHFELSLKLADNEDPLARRHIENAAQLLLAETKKYLGQGVGSTQVLRRVRSGLEESLEKQSLVFYELLQARTRNLLQLLGNA